MYSNYINKNSKCYVTFMKKCILCNLQQSSLALGKLSYNSNGTCLRYNCLLTDSFNQMNVNISLVVGIEWVGFERV